MCKGLATSYFKGGVKNSEHDDLVEKNGNQRKVLCILK